MSDRQAFLRHALGWWLAYVSLLAPVVLYSAIRFAPLYPADSLTTHPELSAIYKTFVGLTGMLLAIALGIGAAVFGASRSILQAGLALLAGAATTIAALSIVPLVRFPEDQYPPAGLFVIADGLPLVTAFVLATLAGRLLTSSRATHVAI